MIIRRANENEYEEFLKLCKQVHSQHVNYRGDIFKEVDVPISKEDYVDLIENNIFVQVVDREIIGYVTLFIKETKNSILCNRRFLYLDTIVIKDMYQRKGYGELLFDFVKQYAKENKCDSIELQVSKENEGALKFYKKNSCKIKEYKLEIKL